MPLLILAIRPHTNKISFIFHPNFTENLSSLPVCIKLFATFAKVFYLSKTFVSF